jgi:hypothetical protein
VQNPNDAVALVTFSFLTAGGLAGQETVSIGANSRYTLPVHLYEPGVDISVRVQAEAGKPVVAVRSMYFDYQGRRGGHAAPGSSVPFTHWYFAEGYTGD